MSDSIFWECISKNCERARGKACIVVMPNTSPYDMFFDKHRNAHEKISVSCPFLEVMDCDNSEWEQISRVSITRKY